MIIRIILFLLIRDKEIFPLTPPDLLSSIKMV